MKDWIDGTGGYFDPLEVKNHLEAVLPILESHAEQDLAEFDFTNPKYAKVIKSGWFRKEKVLPLFNERMPAKIENSIRKCWDDYDSFDRVICNTCLLPSEGVFTPARQAELAAQDIAPIARSFIHIKKIKGVLNGIKIAIDSGMKNVVFTDEALKYYSSVVKYLKDSRDETSI